MYEEVSQGLKNIPDSRGAFTRVGGESAGGTVIFLQETSREPATHSAALAGILNKNKISTFVPYSRSVPATDAEIAMLAGQICRDARRLREQEHMSSIGYFGAGAEAEAVLIAAAQEPELVQAVVIRGRRPDEFSSLLPLIQAPVLLIAPGREPACVRSNRAALAKLNGQSAMNVISGASAAFREPGVFEEAAQLASLWFLQYLS